MTGKKITMVIAVAVVLSALLVAIPSDDASADEVAKYGLVDRIDDIESAAFEIELTGDVAEKLAVALANTSGGNIAAPDTVSEGAVDIYVEVSDKYTITANILATAGTLTGSAGIKAIFTENMAPSKIFMEGKITDGTVTNNVKACLVFDDITLTDMNAAYCGNTVGKHISIMMSTECNGYSANVQYEGVFNIAPALYAVIAAGDATKLMSAAGDVFSALNDSVDETVGNVVITANHAGVDTQISSVAYENLVTSVRDFVSGSDYIQGYKLKGGNSYHPEKIEPVKTKTAVAPAPSENPDDYVSVDVESENYELVMSHVSDTKTYFNGQIGKVAYTTLSESDKNTVWGDDFEYCIESTSLTVTEIEDAITASKAHNPGAPVVAISISDNVTISKEILTKLSEESDVTLRISAPMANVLFDVAAIDNLCSGTDDSGVVVSITDPFKTGTLTEAQKYSVLNKLKTSQAVEISVTNNDETVNLNGTATVTVPYNNTDSKDLKAYYIQTNGKISKVSNAIFDQSSSTATFTTGHFSTYALSSSYGVTPGPGPGPIPGPDPEPGPGPTPGPEPSPSPGPTTSSGDDSDVVVACAAAAVAIIVILLIFMVLKRD